MPREGKLFELHPTVSFPLGLGDARGEVFVRWGYDGFYYRPMNGLWDRFITTAVFYCIAQGFKELVMTCTQASGPYYWWYQ